MIHEDNVDAIQARVVIEAANGPITHAADTRLRDRGVTVVPDVLANAGGVIVSYFEWVQNRQRYRWEKAKVEDRLDRLLEGTWAVTADLARERDLSHREAAYRIAVERVRRAAYLRGF